MYPKRNTVRPGFMRKERKNPGTSSLELGKARPNGQSQMKKSKLSVRWTARRGTTRSEDSDRGVSTRQRSMFATSMRFGEKLDMEGGDSWELRNEGPRIHRRGVRDAKTAGDEYTQPLWYRTRKSVAELLATTWFKCFMGVIIMLNMGLVAYDTDVQAATQRSKAWVEIASTVFLGIYAVEVTLRLYAYRWEIFYQPMSVFDLYIVFSDIVFKVIGDIWDDSPSLSVMRVLRCVRIVRVFRSLVAFRELYLMMQGLFSALKAIFWAMFMLFVVFSIFGILAVTYLNPLNQELAQEGMYDECGDPCINAFQTVMNANLHFVKTIIAGDSWGQVSVPLITRHPVAGTAILISVLLITQIGVLNLIVAVIVDKATEARKDDKELKHAEKIESFHEATNDLMTVFQKMDHDNSGSLSKQELLEGFELEESFAETLQLMDIGREDLDLLFYILDKDRSGDINYKEFIEQLYMMKSQDPHTLLIFIRHICRNLEEGITNMNAAFRQQVKLMEERSAKQDTHLDELRLLFQSTIDSFGLLKDSKGVKPRKDTTVRFGADSFERATVRFGSVSDAKTDPSCPAPLRATQQKEAQEFKIPSESASDSAKLQRSGEDSVYSSLELLRLQVQHDAMWMQRQVEQDLGILSDRILRSTAMTVGQVQQRSYLRATASRNSSRNSIASSAEHSSCAGGEASSQNPPERSGPSDGIACLPSVSAWKHAHSTKAPSVFALRFLEPDSGPREAVQPQKSTSLSPAPEVEWGIEIDLSAEIPEKPAQ